MSSLDRMTLENAIPVIQRLFSSIAVKTLFLKNDDDWINVFTVILPAKRAKSDLIARARNLDRCVKDGKIKECKDDCPDFERKRDEE